MPLTHLLLTLQLLACAIATPIPCVNSYAALAPEGVPAVQSVEREISDSGGSHAGVFVVKTDRGEMVLKVRNTPMPIKAQALEVQEELARRGMAPHVYGVIEGETLAALRPALKAKQQKRFLPPMESDQGIFMEYIANGWNCPSSEKPLPAAAARWNREKILGRIDEIEKALAEMNVQVMNPQILIDEAGTVHMIDFEMVVRGTAEQPRRTSLHVARDAFTEAWKAR